MTTCLRRGGFIAAVALAVLTAGVAGSLAASGASGAIPAGYTGVESKLPTAFKTPAKKAGPRCTIGFQNPIAANEFLGLPAEGGRRRGQALRLHGDHARRRAQPRQAGLATCSSCSRRRSA